MHAGRIHAKRIMDTIGKDKSVVCRELRGNGSRVTEEYTMMQTVRGAQGEIDMPGNAKVRSERPKKFGVNLPNYSE